MASEHRLGPTWPPFPVLCLIGHETNSNPEKEGELRVPGTGVRHTGPACIISEVYALLNPVVLDSSEDTGQLLQKAVV